MSVESDFYSALSGSAGLSGVVGTKIYPLVVPQGTVLPCVTYFKVSDVPEHLMGVDASIRTVRMQVSCWGRTYAEAKSVAAAVRTALSRNRTNFKDIFVDSELDLYEDETQIYHVAIDFIVYWS